MDSSSKIFGASVKEEEECHSSESGWTMYIGSPIDDDDGHVDVDDDDDDDDDDNDGGGDDDSDDSMVSDASSGMAPHTKNHEQGQQNVNHDDDDGDQKKVANRKGKKVEKKIKGYEERKEKKGESSINVVPAQGGNKVRRNWIGKKK